MDEQISRKEFQELKELVEDALDAAEENNKILKRMQHVGRVAFVAKTLMWTVVLVLPFFLLPFISPYLNIIPGLGGTGTSTSLFGYPSPSELQHAIEQYKNNL